MSRSRSIQRSDSLAGTPRHRAVTGVSRPSPASVQAFFVDEDRVVQGLAELLDHFGQRRLVELDVDRPLELRANPRFGRQATIQIRIDQQAPVGDAIRQQQIGHRVDLRGQPLFGLVLRRDQQPMGLFHKHQVNLTEQEPRVLPQRHPAETTDAHSGL